MDGFPKGWTESWPKDGPNAWDEGLIRATSRAGTGEEVVCHVWKKKGVPKPKNILLISHGIGEHGDRYRHFVHHLNAQFDEIWAPDHYGHGLSQGKKGTAPHFEVFADDLRQWASLILAKTKNLHLAGHSMGGLVAIRLLQRYPDVPVKTALLSSPYLGLAAVVPALKKAASKLFLKIAPNLVLGTGLVTSALARDPNVVAAYEADPLVHGLISPRLFETMMESQADANAGAELLARRVIPILFMLPMKDQIVSVPATLAFYERVANLVPARVRLVKLDHSFHEGFNDLDRGTAFTEYVKFLAERAPS